MSLKKTTNKVEELSKDFLLKKLEEKQMEDLENAKILLQKAIGEIEKLDCKLVIHLQMNASNTVIPTLLIQPK